MKIYDVILRIFYLCGVYLYIPVYNIVCIII